MSKQKKTRKRTPAKAADAVPNAGISPFPSEVPCEAARPEVAQEVSPEVAGEVAPEAPPETLPPNAEPSAEGPDRARIERAPAQIQRIEEPLEQLFVSKYYEAFPRQKEFHESKAKYRLFGGAAGPGKTTALLWEAIRQANEHPKVDTLLLPAHLPGARVHADQPVSPRCAPQYLQKL